MNEDQVSKDTVDIQTETSSPEAIPSIKNSSRVFPFGLFIFLIILTLFFAIGSYYFYSQKKSSSNSSFVPTPSLVPTAILNKTENWKLYSNTKYGYSIRYPDNLTFELSPDEETLTINKHITLGVSKTDPTNCRGDCQGPASFSNERIGTYTFAVGKGILGSIGGNIPQSFYEYITEYNNYYFDFHVYELSIDSEASQERQIGEVPKEKLELLRQILSTFTILDKTDTSSLKIPKEFPIYPNAKLIDEVDDPCDSKTDQPDFCFKKTITWETADDGDTVKNWYQDDKSHSGWVCGKSGSGEYTDSREFSFSSSCVYNGSAQWVRFILSAQPKKTSITIKAEPIDTNNL